MGDEMQPTGTVTFLFTDIEGSTRHWQERAAEMPAALEAHDALIRQMIEEFHGYVFSTGGDGFAAAFSLATDAIEAAAHAQVGMLDFDFLEVRMGMHTGEAQVRDGDYFGSAVNKAARIMAAGHGGQTLMSSTTATLVEGHPVKNLGEYRLPDLDSGTVIWQLGTDDFRSLRTLDDQPGNLPVQRNSFIGRTDEVKAVRAALEDARLATLVGPSGVGKSRLAVQAAAEAAHTFGGGAWFAPLGSLNEPELVASAILDAVGLGDRRGETAEDVLDDWFSSRPVLLIIDNCEHLLDAVAAVVDHLLDLGTDSRILATSQAPLAVTGETVQGVEPLVGGGSASDSVLLFAERARSVRSGFELSDENEAAVMEICDKLDHVPLAIELAASRVRAMSPADIAKRLDQRFRLLSTSDRSAPGRHRTLEAALRWSYELLDDAQRLVLRRLSVFGAPFDLDVAEVVVADDDAIETWEVLDAVTGLVDKSLVIARDHGDSVRYSLLESVRQFALTELDKEDDRAGCEQRYVDHSVALISDVRERLVTPGDVEAMAELDGKWEHVRHALRAATVDPSRFEELYMALHGPFLHLGKTPEGVLWAGELVTMPVDDARARLDALGSAGQITANVSLQAGVETIEAGHRILEETGVDAPAMFLAAEAIVRLMNGQLDAGSAAVDAALAVIDDEPDLYRRFQATTSTCSALGILGRTSDVAGMLEAHEAVADRCGARWMRFQAKSSAMVTIHELNPDGTEEFFQEAVREIAALGDDSQLANISMFHGIDRLRRRDVFGAVESLRLAIDSAAAEGKSYIGQTVGVVISTVMQEYPYDAAVLLGALETWRIQRKHPGTRPEMDATAFFVDRLGSTLGDEVFQQGLAAGRLLEEEALVARAHAAMDRLVEGVNPRS